MQPIETRLKLLFAANEEDVTEDIMPDLLSFEYTDNETDEADEISISLKDDTGKWASSWQPEGGEIVKASITEGTVDTKGRTLNCGTFFVDTLGVSGAPQVVTIKAVSTPLNKPIRRKQVTRAWEGVTLAEILNEIASKAGMAGMYIADGISYDRIDQSKESDLSFLARLSKENGLSMKVTHEKIVIFDQQKFESKSPVATFERGSDRVLSWIFEQQAAETYKSVKVTYKDPKQNGFDKGLNKNRDAVKEYTYTNPEADESGQEFELKKRAKSLEEAERMAKAKMRELNLKSVTGSMTVIGNVGLCSGSVIEVVGFGSFDGNFAITKAGHSYGTGGYVTSLDLRRTNANY